MQTPRHPMAMMLEGLERHVPLVGDDRQAILDLPHTLRMLEAASYTVREADSPMTCAVLVSGYAFRQKLTGDGARQILSLHMPGESLDLENLFLTVSDHSVQMLTRGQVAIVKRADLQTLARERPALAHAFLVRVLIEASIFREWILNVGRRDARARVAHLLCEVGVRLDVSGLAADHGYELPMTQEQIGDAVGLTSVHVNRTLRALEADGLITRTKRTIGFPDWKRLRSAGDFNERYLHFDQGRAATA